MSLQRFWRDFANLLNSHTAGADFRPKLGWKCRTWVAVVLYRVLRMRLKASDRPLSPTRALEIARKIQFHRVTLHRRETASGLTKLKPEQRDLFEAIGLPVPAASRL